MTIRLPGAKCNPTGARADSTYAQDPDNAAACASRQQIVAELERVKHALTVSRQEAKADRRKIESLRRDNLRLKANLVDLVRDKARTRFLAYQDELTGLPNRRLLKDRLDQALARSARHDTQVVLLLIDLDDFKSINDNLGHAAGDHVLRMVARRLAGGIRGADTACRYGGDEFVVVLPDIEDTKMALKVARQLLAAIGAPYLVNGHQIRMSASAGSVVYPDDGVSCTELFRKADTALYGAKAADQKVSFRRLPEHGSKSPWHDDAGRTIERDAGLCIADAGNGLGLEVAGIEP